MSWRVINGLAILAAVFVGVSVVLLKNEVHERKASIRALKAEIREHQDAIRVLNAEWALLASPGLLQDRSMRFLALMPMRAEQIVESPAVVPFRRKGEVAPADRGILLKARAPKPKPSRSKTGQAKSETES